jgi:Suppressor of fused protein (SUFU)
MERSPVSEDEDWFAATWRYREKVLYPEVFGGSGDGMIVTVPYQAFAQLGSKEVDRRWLHCGVLKFGSRTGRDAITFVTSGLSNAWDDERPDRASASGLGVELRIDNRSDEHWALDVLLRISAMQLMIGAGRFRGARIVGDGDRIRVGADTFGQGSAMAALLASKAADLELPSGTFEMIQLFAITGSELEFATTHGVTALIAELRRETTYPINDIRRQSVV